MLSASLLALSACRYPATVVVFVLGSDAPAERTARVDARVWRAEMQPSITGTTFDREGLSLEGEALFSVVPNGEPRSQRVELRLQATLAATPTEPTQVIRRALRFSFIPQTRLVQRVFFSMACLNRSTDCRQNPSTCTVQDACEERGLTCGDNGECVAIDVTPEPASDASVRFDASPLRDSSREASGPDASFDAGFDAGSPQDASLDAATDTGIDARADTGIDARADAAIDARADSAADARADSGIDAGTDAGTDAGATIGPVALIAAGSGGATCATSSATRLSYCWGNSGQGRTALGNGVNVNRPTRTVLSQEIQALSVGRFHACFVSRQISPVVGGDVYCFGSSNNGQCGVISPMVTAGQRTPGPLWTMVATGFEFTCFANARDVRCMGAGSLGQLGNGTMPMMSATPVTVTPTWTAGETIRQLDADTNTACVVTSADALYCWGAGFGARPVRLSLANVRSVAVGQSHLCAVTNSNELYCWGNNSNGQLGDGTTMSRAMPTLINVAGAAITAVNAGVGTTCAIDTMGLVYCWGDNQYATVGNGTVGGNVLVPARIVVDRGAVRAIDVGFGTTCAVSAAGIAYCWGLNGEGQVGNGTNSANVPAPAAVLLN